MRIPEDKIEEVRRSSDIVDVISGYVALKKRGKSYLGLCPFHQEKTPSFNVSADRQMYHCFGCGVGGNVFTFVMEHDKVSFLEAVRTLAEKAGIRLPEEGTADAAQATENEALYAACRMAGRYYYDTLVNTIEGKLALEYFHHRGFTDDTIRKFGLGYSLNSWDGLVKFAERENVSIEVLERAGLALRRDDGSSVHDRFRGRAMFPIFSHSGRTIAFGARKMREDDPLGKYINSPETPIYSKSRTLYGLYQAKEAIREKEFAILVEGYADLISVYQAGIMNIVASSGTALTEEQTRLIARYARNVTFVYDGDSAGSNAMMRGVDVLIENGLDVRVAVLPSGDDPDSFVKKQGGPAFQQLLDHAVSFLDFKLGTFKKQGLLETPEGKAKAVRSVVETIAKMKDELKRNFYVKDLAERYQIYESVLFRELDGLLGGNRGGRIKDNAAAPPPLQGSPTAGQFVPPPAQPPAPERDLLKVMLEHGNEMVQYVFTYLTHDMFLHPDVRAVVDVILREAESGADWDARTIIDSLETPQLKHFVSDVIFNKYELGSGWAKMGKVPDEPDPWHIAEECIVRMRVTEIDRLLNEAGRLFRDAEHHGEDLQAYREQIRSLQEEKRTLQTVGLRGVEG